MKTVLTIAGSDCSGGAGIQADIKTITAHKLYAMSAITALTAQNTTGVSGIAETVPDFLNLQLHCIFSDIYPDAVKIGMVSGRELVKVIAAKLKEYNAPNVVLDPVMVSTSGSRLMADDGASALMEYLLPLADVITPNIPEAEVLSGIEIHDSQDMARAAKKIAGEYPGAVLLKGGHRADSADDLLYYEQEVFWFRAPRIESSNTHGTGCTLSSAIAANLAKGCTLPDSIKNAKEYISGALGAGLNLGAGSGPMDHTYAL